MRSLRVYRVIGATTVERLLISGVVTALLVVSVTARAVSVFSASTTNGTPQSNSTGASSTGLAGGPLAGEPAGSSFTQQESAAANAGGLHASARATLNVTPSASLGMEGPQGFAGATMTFDDLVITGPQAGSVPGSLNLHLDGTFGTNVSYFGLFGDKLTSQAQVTLTGYIAAFANHFDGAFIQTRIVVPYSSDKTSVVGQDLFSGTGPLPVNVTTAMFNLPVNTPFSLQLQLQVQATSQSSVVGTGCDATGCNASFLLDTLSDFSNSASLAVSGPVLNLPQGFTLNSVEAGIVNNTNTLVPEPATGVLVMVGVLGLAVARCRAGVSA